MNLTLVVLANPFLHSTHDIIASAYSILVFSVRFAIAYIFFYWAFRFGVWFLPRFYEKAPKQR